MIFYKRRIEALKKFLQTETDPFARRIIEKEICELDTMIQDYLKANPKR